MWAFAFLVISTMKKEVVQLLIRFYEFSSASIAFHCPLPIWEWARDIRFKKQPQYIEIPSIVLTLNDGKREARTGNDGHISLL